MAKFVFAYTGGPGMAPTPEEGQAIMAAWGQWFGQIGQSLVDPGAPCGASKAVKPGGAVGATAAGLSGYSIVNAASLDAAVELAKGCPVLSNGGTVEVYETIDVM
jgi:hypothetical protein